ncbi:MAG: hypothetical protein ABUT39_24215 [Acidobacteriota bacterium]
MSLRKCPQCGLVAFSQDEACRRCGADLAATATSAPAAPVAGDLKPTSVRPTAFRIIRTDYLSSLLVILPLVGFGLYVITEVFGLHIFRRGVDVSDPSASLRMGLIAATIGLPILVWRLRSIQGLFARAVEVPGSILSADFHRSRGRIEFSYFLQGEEYRGGAAVQENDAVRRLLSRDEVVVVVDPANPKKAFLRDLFAD